MDIKYFSSIVSCHMVVWGLRGTLIFCTLLCMNCRAVLHILIIFYRIIYGNIINYYSIYEFIGCRFSEYGGSKI